MKKSRFTEEQIAMALRQVEAGTPIAEVCRKLQVTEQTFYRCKKKFGSLGTPDVKRHPPLRTKATSRFTHPPSGELTDRQGVALHLPCWATARSAFRAAA